MKPSSFLVIGAGLAGASTAWRLAQRGHDVTVLERSEPANEKSSSHGSARIFRYAYADPFYVGLVQRTRPGWDELERAAGQTLISSAGCVDFGALRDPVGLAGVLETQGVEHQLLSSTDAAERWPGIAFDSPVLWHEAAGVIDAESSVHAMLTQAVAHGARVRSDWTVARVEKTALGYRAHSTSGDKVEAERVVVAAGGWLPDLLSEIGLPQAFLEALPTFTVRQEQAYHFPYADPDAAGSWPTLISKSDQIQVYGLPGGRDADFRGQKIAEYNGGRTMPSAAHQDGRIDPRNRERVIAYVKEFLPGLVPEPYAETTCLFTNTPHEDFLIDGVDGITIVSPCSGHGAKFAPLVGEFAADLATGEGGVPDRFRVAASGVAA
ncbi:MAG: FAD-dependent oxidoreductase [Microbacterium sp.]|uniref:FAD-dependent oxidoreductase n=1 Tax=Microbacterium sp. TaxID=51671 RepID=UPI002722852B|nr:FAD-dependent oxidoreductase [Microbacterium sp.]MDO8382684.1 FAD-dependent oxidoreductase [Microbacterium sp.]